MPIEILPSILSADFARLGDQVAALESAACGMFHVDVMDGHFVPNITIGPPVVESLRKVTRATFDVHLMITDPDKYAPQFIQAGADQVSVHQEACRHLDRTLRMIRSEGADALREVDALASHRGFVGQKTPILKTEDPSGCHRFEK